MSKVDAFYSVNEAKKPRSRSGSPQQQLVRSGDTLPLFPAFGFKFDRHFFLDGLVSWESDFLTALSLKLHINRDRNRFLRFEFHRMLLDHRGLQRFYVRIARVYHGRAVRITR